MPTTELTPDEIVQRGKQWYEQGIRATVETPENVGRFLVIDIENGDWEMGERGDETLFRALDKRPGHLFYRMRIGYPATYSIGATMKPTMP